MVLYFTAISPVYAVGVGLRFVNSRHHLSDTLAICSQVQLVSSVVHHCVVYFRATRISVCHPHETHTS
jgi:hypothetical protein